MEHDFNSSSWDDSDGPRHPWLFDSLLVKLLATGKFRGSNIDRPVSAASSSCEHSQFDQSDRFADGPSRSRFSNDHDKCSNQHYYCQLRNKPHSSPGQRLGSAPVLPNVLRGNFPRKPDGLSKPVDLNLWKYNMDEYDCVSDPERDERCQGNNLHRHHSFNQ